MRIMVQRSVASWCAGVFVVAGAAAVPGGLSVMAIYD